ncbi:MAG: flavin reductase family protein [Candidatus Omnitrophica bacterium]|nr:flavin reductase family protein [Candidatus Omnitrophota bacterium]MDE2009348.1 flavin reductase family protein [Candidatus Omnitrophota bacterium]MDE2214132.1 flavin reductase family protein [Candidatus Omnitrophota bacterium]MDE2231169.1 flavin reductase family protein [Candidatus Omnitrophota bacterium]
MIVDCGQYTADQMYFLLIQLVIPRPVAWVLSDNGNGTHNLAPFSFFNAITANPPILMISVGWKDDKLHKDTWVNIGERSHFVVHIPRGGQVHDVSNSSSVLPHGVSEIETFGIATESPEGWPLPRVTGAAVAFCCEKYAIYEIGRDPQGLILGKINRIWIDEEAVSRSNNRIVIDPAKIDPLARLGGNHYALLGEILTVKRPDKP